LRVLVLSKRQYMGKDLLDDGYGRFYELPLELSRRGHRVRGVCASYRPRPEGEVAARGTDAEVRWRSVTVRPFSPAALWRWAKALEGEVRAFRPERIWACSDSFHAILGVWLQRRHGVPCVIDLYDNFEGYGASHIPGVLALLRRATRRAAGITCISAPLERHVRAHYGSRAPMQVLENGVSAHFVPQDRARCRGALGLPLDAKVIGTAGAIDTARGVEDLFRAFLSLAERRSELYLVLAGRLLGGARVPAHERIRYLGELDHAQIPAVIGAMDLCVVCNRRTAFGEYAFPQKLYEAIACGVPPLVARTEGVAHVLEKSAAHGYEPGSLASLTQGIEFLLERPAMPPVAPRSWRDLGEALSAFLALAAKDVA